MITLVTGYAGVQHITSDDAGSFNVAMFGNGQLVMDRGNRFTATIENDNLIRIADGDALMQGRHIRIKTNDYEELDISRGVSGCVRHDLVVITYEKNEITSVESAKLEVLEGVPVADGTEIDPSYTVGDLLNGDIKNQMPLYRVIVEDYTIKEVQPLFETTSSFKTISDGITKQVEDEKIKWNEQVESSIQEFEEKFDKAYEDIADENLLVKLNDRTVAMYDIPIVWSDKTFKINSTYINEKSIVEILYEQGAEIDPTYLQADGSITISVETLPKEDIKIEAVLIINPKEVS